MRQTEQHGIDVIDWQVSTILKAVQVRVWRPSRHQRSMPRTVAEIFSKFHIAPRRQLVTFAGDGKLGPPMALDCVPVLQRLDDKIIGRIPEVQVSHGTAQRKREAVEPNHYGGRIHGVLPEFKKLYEDWEEQWRRDQRWDNMVKIMRERLSLSETESASK